MSLTALRAAFGHITQHEMTPSASLVLLCLANRHNQETGRCDPSLARIASDAGINERSVRRALRELEALKLVTTVHRVARSGRGKRNMTNRYRLKGGGKLSAGMGTECPPKQEYTPSAFDDLVMLVEGQAND